MKNLRIYFVISLSAVIFLLGSSICKAQGSIQLSDIEIVNLGDKQLYAHKKGDYNSPVNGKSRIITGVSTEYFDAQFEDGFAIGKWEYYANNNKTAVMNYVGGYLDGEFCKYYSGGDLEVKGHYLKGQKHGSWETFKSDGTIKLTEAYENDKRTKTITHYADGSVDRERNFKNGKEHGVDRQYTSEGVLRSEKYYVNGKQTGPQMQLYNSNAGNYIQKSNYNEQGQLDGAYLESYEKNGAVKIKGQYKNGHKIGKWIYGYSHALSKEEIYEDGKLVKTTLLNK